MHARIWYEPSGQVKVTTLTDGADIGDVAQVLIQDGHVHPDATFDDVETPSELATLLPAGNKRHKWRKSPTGHGVIEDPAVPDPPHPNRDLLMQLQAANSVPELKDLLRTMLQRGG